MSLGFTSIPPRNFATRSVTDDEILRLWKLGLDTYAIAAQVGVPESQIESRLHAIKDALRADQEWNWPPEPNRVTP